jgi:hypothetical protein
MERAALILAIFLNNTFFIIKSRNNIRFSSFTGIIHRRVYVPEIVKSG